MIQLWRANIDVQLVLSKQDVLSYATKYTAKGEAKSLTFDAILSDILATKVQTGDAAKKVVRKLLITSVAERVYLA